ncbi:MAG: TIGR00159 family protein, partial [Oscillospiraceae bacterium]
MTEFFSSIGNSFNVLYNTISWVDLLDVALVAYVIYQVISLVRQTRAASLARGIVVLLVGYFLSIQLGLKTMKFLLDTVLQFGLILLVVVFQPELRSALEKVGRKSFGRFSFLTSKISSEEKARWNDAIVRICDSAEKMSRTRTGALIVIERTTALGDTLSTGTAMDSIVT